MGSLRLYAATLNSNGTLSKPETLSTNRAKSVMEYMVKNGIDAKRLTGRGYGETRLVNKCADGIKCTEEEYQQNRRSEFIIIEI